jgi:hypothetical protein
MSADPKPASAWREPMVWLVVGGPAAVIVASFITLGLAIRHPDPPLDLRVSPQRAAEQVQPAAANATAGDPLPAMVGRNHAATGVAGARR